MLGDDEAGLGLGTKVVGSEVAGALVGVDVVGLDVVGSDVVGSAVVGSDVDGEICSATIHVSPGTGAPSAAISTGIRSLPGPRICCCALAGSASASKSCTRPR